jgi:threonine/homoserine/homoserine lactone efflux protein
MHPLLRIFLVGMLVSFLGSLPLGTLNIAAMQISISDGIVAALMFSLGSLLAEVIYVRLSLVAMDWVRKQEKIFKILEWLTLFIVAALAIASFYAALNPSEQKNVILSSNLPKVLLGFTMSALNPVQIPFWFGWSTVLFTKKILQPRNDHYNIYIAGIGIGTFIGNLLFIFGGRLIADKIKNNQHVLNWIIGGIFAVTALIQLWKIWRKKDAAHQLEHPEEVSQKIEEQVDKFEERMEKIEEGIDKMKHKDKDDA